ncbi:MAG TPA: PrsW family glutamic-type intramembrane protease [Ktedonobacteraceae bacterium]
MSTQRSHSTPEPDAQGEQQPAADQVSEEPAFSHVYEPVDPQQQFREYASTDEPDAPAASLSEVFSASDSLPPAYVGPDPYTPFPYAYSGYPPYLQSSQADRSATAPAATPDLSADPLGLPYGYAWSTPPTPPTLPTRPRRDIYLLVTGIIAFICSCLVMLAGLASLGIIVLLDLASASIKTTISDGSYFASLMLLLTFALAGLVGGGFCLYHSIRSLFLRKPSRTIWLPGFWVFLLCYLAVLGIGYWLHIQGMDISSPLLTGGLIYLGGIFPALTLMALGLRRLSKPERDRSQPRRGRRMPRQWPTSWRRMTLALVSGATLSIGLALLLEFIFELLLAGKQFNALNQFMSNPDAGNPPPSLYALILLVFAVVAPLVEELAKPLAVVVLIGRVGSKAEAFALGLACGIGFDIVETIGYISSAYNDWLNVALVRAGSGLLHGFGAAMAALGWYYLTHKAEGAWLRRASLAFACIGYAVLQHALWNGALGLTFLPDPIGSFFQHWSWSYGPLELAGTELVNIGEVIVILIFFVYMCGRLRVGSSRKRVLQPEADLSLALKSGTL